jgi:hypothetical protein
LENLILVATLGGPPMFARIGVMMGLKQNVEQTLNSSRKDPHSGKRKLARDQTTGQVSWLHPDNITANGADYFGNSSVCGAFIDTRDLRAGFLRQSCVSAQQPRIVLLKFSKQMAYL